MLTLGDEPEPGQLVLVDSAGQTYQVAGLVSASALTPHDPSLHQPVVQDSVASVPREGGRFQPVNMEFGEWNILDAGSEYRINLGSDVDGHYAMVDVSYGGRDNPSAWQGPFTNSVAAGDWASETVDRLFFPELLATAKETAPSPQMLSELGEDVKENAGLGEDWDLQVAGP